MKILALAMNSEHHPGEDDLLLNILRDADKLDAIGAIGVVRTITYGASKGIPFYKEGTQARTDLDQETYMKNEACVRHHFDEKLLRLKDMMRTKAGSEMAEHRHQFVVQFLEEFHPEWEGKL